MATTSAAPLGSILFPTEGGGISHKPEAGGDSLEQQEAAEKKRLHPFFNPNQRTEHPSDGASPSISAPCAAPSAEESKSRPRTARRKPEREPVAASRTQAKKRKGKGKAKAEVGVGLTRSSNAEPSNVANMLVQEEGTTNAPPNASMDIVGTAHITLGDAGHGAPGGRTDDGGSLESDLNSSRRKRQKTLSPGVTEVPIRPEEPCPSSNSNTASGANNEYHTFYLQLRATANGGVPEFNQDTAMVYTPSPITQSEMPLPKLPESPSTPPGQIVEISSDPIIPDTNRAPLGSPNAHTISLISPSPLPAPPTESDLSGRDVISRKKSPQRKLLRLNAKGKFSSPISKGPRPEDRRKVEGKKPSATKKAKKRKVTIVKYGADDDSVSSISRKIDDILSSPPRPGSTGSPVAPEVATKPQPPPKPTHPFFTGKLSRPDTNAPALSAVRRSSAFGAGVATSGSDTDHGTSPSPLKRSTERNGASNPDRFSSLSSSRGCMMSPSKTRAVKVPGALEPLWPPNGMLHIRGLDESSTSEQRTLEHNSDREPNNQITVPRRERKLKSTLIRVPETEGVVSCLSSGLNVASQRQRVENAITTLGEYCYLSEVLRLPNRALITGREIQKLVRRQMRYFLPSAAASRGEDSSTDNSYDSDDGTKKAHPALLALYHSIPASLTPFDRAECETQSWVCKYAPKCSRQILQSGREALILRDWLRGLTVVSVDTGSADVSKGRAIHGSKKSSMSGKNKTKSSKKRRRNEDMDGFIISSDEEANEMDEITDPEDEETLSGNGSLFKRTVVRVGDPRASGIQTSKLTNAIVISGPHGCGKTAAVYAVAKELGFEVFEVNAGSRRSGKDVLEKVGEMTRNHLVHRANGGQADASADSDTTQAPGSPLRDLGTEKQGIVRSLLKNKGQTAPGRPPKGQGAEKDTAQERKQPQQQKQSLILLEEIDILFEEDKQFWATVVSLIAQSKRPIIMTCNDESLVPYDTLSLHAILRFVPPPEDLAVDYLLLIAASEGHILRRESLRSLYSAKNRDLRASIMEMDYWCQMGIGDRKSGLEWMIQRWPPGKDVNGSVETLRVASKDTYVAGMGWLGREACRAADGNISDDEEEILVEAWDGWEIDVEDWHERDDMKEWAAEVTSKGKKSKLNRTIVLSAYETFLESLSAADVYAGQGMRSGNQIICDPTLPNPPDRHRFDDVLGWRALRSHPLVRYDRINSQMPAYAKSLAKRALRNNTLDLHTDSQIESLYEQDMIENIISLNNASHSRRHLSHADLATAFTPIAAPPVFVGPQPTYTISSFDRGSSLIATDLAPYVRTIISHELRREEERCRVAGLLSQGRSNGKKARTTRSSRSALAGRSRVSMRREKWFDGKINASRVLRTGGEGWQKVAARRLLRAVEDDDDDADELGIIETRMREDSTEDSEV
ncbi:MAG: hypothetical protein M1839_004065 [Geoglossum umbratile]|nr:MAG: hypothetical protein M1839_004065 [Geoglossum umbratile]